MLKKIIVIIGFLVGLLGAVLVSYGAWLAAPAAGFSVGGGFCLLWSWMVSRSFANDAVPQQPKGDD